MAREYEKHRPDRSIDEHVRYWQGRAAESGRPGVAHQAHDQAEIDREESILRTHFGVAIAGLKKRRVLPVSPLVLDFGCGWGRWSRFLAAATDGHVTGIDLSPTYIEDASPTRSTSFRLHDDPMVPIPFGDSFFDMIFTCTVLQHLVREDLLHHVLNEFDRVLRPGGVLLMFEATADLPPKKHIVFRSTARYQELVSWAKLSFGWEHVIRGELHALMAGVKP